MLACRRTGDRTDVENSHVSVREIGEWMLVAKLHNAGSSPASRSDEDTPEWAVGDMMERMIWT